MWIPARRLGRSSVANRKDASLLDTRNIGLKSAVEIGNYMRIVSVGFEGRRFRKRRTAPKTKLPGSLVSCRQLREQRKGRHILLCSNLLRRKIPTRISCTPTHCRDPQLQGENAILTPLGNGAI
jgi:hypothetical protein